MTSELDILTFFFYYWKDLDNNLSECAKFSDDKRKNMQN